jgi:PAS domain S-box-containing protein
MNDQDKNREQLIEELAELRQRLATVEPAPDWRRQLEEALNQREERFRSLIEHSYGAIVLIDASGNFTYTSSSIHRILGYQAEELLGTYGFDLVHPDDVNTALLKFTGILQGPKSIDDMEVRIQHKDAGWRCFEVIGTNLLDDPAVQGVVVNFWDITERKQAEADLRHSAERLRQARQAGGVSIWEWDLLTGQFFWDGDEPIHGWEPGAFLDSFEVTLEDIHPEDRMRSLRRLTRRLSRAPS